MQTASNVVHGKAETQKGREDKESIKDRPPATLGPVDYLGKRFYQVDRKIARTFDDDSWIQRDE